MPGEQTPADLADWRSAMGPDERLIWQDRPQGRLRHPDYRFNRVGVVIAITFTFFGLFFSYYIERLARRSGYSEPWYAHVIAHSFSMCFILVGLWMVRASVIAPILRRRKTAYALTDQAALIYNGETVRRWTFAHQSPPQLREARSGLGSVIFARERYQPVLGLRLWSVDVGFFNIAHADTVQRTMQALLSAHERGGADASR